MFFYVYKVMNIMLRNELYDHTHACGYSNCFRFKIKLMDVYLGANPTYALTHYSAILQRGNRVFCFHFVVAHCDLYKQCIFYCCKEFSLFTRMSSVCVRILCGKYCVL